MEYWRITLPFLDNGSFHTFMASIILSSYTISFEVMVGVGLVLVLLLLVDTTFHDEGGKCWGKAHAPNGRSWGDDMNISIFNWTRYDHWYSYLWVVPFLSTSHQTSIFLKPSVVSSVPKKLIESESYGGYLLKDTSASLLSCRRMKNLAAFVLCIARQDLLRPRDNHKE